MEAAIERASIRLNGGEVWRHDSKAAVEGEPGCDS